MTRPTYAEINLAALRHNYQYAKFLAGGAKAVAVLKADAYGHGAVAAARALAPEADAFGVACSEEALELRAAGIENPILLLEGFFEAAELALIEQHNLWTVIHHPEQLQQFLAARPGRPLNVWLKLDSGMHRLGFPPADYQAAYEQLRACRHCGEIILMSHFARADELSCDYTEQQLALFERSTDALPGPRSLANSPITLAWPDARGRAERGDWIRPGFMLYGWSPLDRIHPSVGGLQPVLSLKSALISIRELAAGEPVGYGARFVCERPSRVGVVAIGYGDGYPRHAINGTPVLVKNKRTRLIGRVSMDMLTVDLTGLPDMRVGDPVELWGTSISILDIARASDTIAYELLTGITRRVPRRYQDSD